LKAWRSVPLPAARTRGEVLLGFQRFSLPSFGANICHHFSTPAAESWALTGIPIHEGGRIVLSPGRPDPPGNFNMTVKRTAAGSVGVNQDARENSAVRGGGCAVRSVPKSTGKCAGVVIPEWARRGMERSIRERGGEYYSDELPPWSGMPGLVHARAGGCGLSAQQLSQEITRPRSRAARPRSPLRANLLFGAIQMTSTITARPLQECTPSTRFRQFRPGL